MATPSEKQSQKNDELTLIVLKDQLASRSFKIPLRLISRFSLVFSFFIFAALLSLFFTFRILLAPAGEEARQILRLQAKISDVQNENQLLKEKLAIDEARFSEAVPTTEDPKLKEGLIFSIPNLPVQLTDFETSWVNRNGPTLKINFNLRYILTDNRSQQGRIVILGKGADAVYTHPKNVFHLHNNQLSINHRSGESFYVSRFRSTEAYLGPALNEKSIRSIDVYLFNEKGEVIFIQSFPAPRAK